MSAEDDAPDERRRDVEGEPGPDLLSAGRSPAGRRKRAGPPPRPGAGPPDEERPGPMFGRRAVWFVGLIGVALVVWVTINAIDTEGPGSQGVPTGERLPPFAAPLVTSDLEGDANVATARDGGSEGVTPACEVRGRDVLNVCALGARAPLVLTFIAGDGDDECGAQLDVLERVRRRFPGVAFAAVDVRGDRDTLRRIVAERGWRMPIGYDSDGAVANVYGVAVCPTTELALPGRVVLQSLVGSVDERRLDRAVRRLVARARARGWRPPGDPAPPARPRPGGGA